MLLLVVAPIIRGGNRHIAMVAMEVLAIVVLAGICLKTLDAGAHPHPQAPMMNRIALAVLLWSPVWLAAVFLIPIPVAVWASNLGRGIYIPLLKSVGIAAPDWIALSLVPDATLASLLVGLPIAAAFLTGHASQLSQLRRILVLVVFIALAQTVLGMLQTAGGAGSLLYFGVQIGRPIGSFANSNHLANYIAMALAVCIWLAHDHLVHPGRWRHRDAMPSFSHRHALALWLACGSMLILGILLSRSRGAAIAGLPLAMLALMLAMKSEGRQGAGRAALLLAGIGLASAITLIGLGSVFSRFELSGLSSAASFRAMLASTTLEAAMAFWPWGAGWGTYADVYSRFQPAVITGYADYAHQDYAQMLFEGGIFFVLVASAFAWLAVSRIIELVKAARLHGRLSRDEMASAICGLGLLGFLLHSLVEFNMRIPANAILAALLAGVYLRPLAARASHDRPA